MSTVLPPIPAKRYFTIGEVAELCGVKPHVLRYWEQEFTQLRPMKRRGNRRYYQHHEVLMVRRIRDLLYDQGFTISGARNRLQELAHFGKTGASQLAIAEEDTTFHPELDEAAGSLGPDFGAPPPDAAAPETQIPQSEAVHASSDASVAGCALSMRAIRKELQEIRALLF
ncbi:MerR family transcriptional regulator [Diaphorobacter ruginosibacter]|uniref:MerR family transcriptional regulator n=1 Tax=Diaphorobacter ruginosibacter TaxID=1715720 RepID=UPI00333E60CB